jgi:hypothetical protein
VARGTSLTPELHAEIVQHARKGVFVSTICDLIGFHRNTLYYWLDRGECEEPDPVFAAFARDFRAAVAAWEIEALDLIASDPKGHKGLQWQLERRLPDKYGSRQRVEHSGPDGSAVSIQTVAKVAILPALEIDEPVDAEAGSRLPTDGAAVVIPSK